MADQEDSDVGIALGVVLGVIALVIALVIGVVVYKTGAAPAAAAGDGYAEVAEVGEPLAKLYFGLGDTMLPADAESALGKVKATFDDNAAKVVLISGFHDESGTAAVNAEVAKNRALSVKTALVAAGVPAERILLRRPAVTLGGADAAEARRVEIRVQ